MRKVISILTILAVMPVAVWVTVDFAAKNPELAALLADRVILAVFVAVTLTRIAILLHGDGK